MRMTPKQRARKRRRRSVPIPEQMGPSFQYLRLIADRMARYDSLPIELAELVDEYGLERAERAARLFNYGRWEKVREHLEEERRQNERLRWEVYGGGLPQGR